MSKISNLNPIEAFNVSKNVISISPTNGVLAIVFLLDTKAIMSFGEMSNDINTDDFSRYNFCNYNHFSQNEHKYELNIGVGFESLYLSFPIMYALFEIPIFSGVLLDYKKPLKLNISAFSDIRIPKYISDVKIPIDIEITAYESNDIGLMDNMPSDLNGNLTIYHYSDDKLILDKFPKKANRIYISDCDIFGFDNFTEDVSDKISIVYSKVKTLKSLGDTINCTLDLSETIVEDMDSIPKIINGDLRYKMDRRFDISEKQMSMLEYLRDNCVVKGKFIE